MTSQEDSKQPITINEGDEPIKQVAGNEQKGGKIEGKIIAAKRFMPKWVTRAMAEQIGREAVLLSTFKEMMVFIVFVISVGIATVGARDSSMFYLTEALKEQFVAREFITSNQMEINFAGIKTASDFWHYTENLMLNSFYYEHYYDNYNPIKDAIPDDKKILFENKLLGVPRIRQVRVRNNSCVIHYFFKKLFQSCFDSYSKASVDKGTFGLSSGSAWSYQDEERTGSISYTGLISTYDGAGYYQDLTLTKRESADRIRELKDNLWITRHTRAIFVDFSIYNANINLFGVCKLIFEFPATGGVLTSTFINTVRLIMFVNQWDYFVFASCIVSYVFILFYLIEETREIIYFKWRYLLQFWSYIDLIIVVMGICSFVMLCLIWFNVESGLVKIKNNPLKYGNLEYYCLVKMAFNNVQAIMLFFICIKIFKYLNFNKTMGQLNNTLKRCAVDIFVFAIMFFIIFLAFAELGYLLFGSQVSDFSSFGVAMFTLLRTILGDFDYGAIEKANRVLAPLYFLSYIFFVFFVLLNMFLAIINDTYADVKTEIAIAPDEMQMTEFLRSKLVKLLHKCGCRIKWSSTKSEFNVTIQNIRDALKKCGFNPLEIEMFFARYNIDPVAEVVDYDVGKVMLELDAQQPAAKEKLRQDSTLVQLSDFVSQQERLAQIDLTIEALGGKVDTLIRKLEGLEHRSRP